MSNITKNIISLLQEKATDAEKADHEMQMKAFLAKGGTVKQAKAKKEPRAKFFTTSSAFQRGRGTGKAGTVRMEEADDEREYDYEGEMAKTQLRSIMRHAEHLHGMLEDADNLPEWVQSKITKAEDYLSGAHDYMMSKMNEQTQIDELSNELMQRYKKEAGKQVDNPSTPSSVKYKRGKGHLLATVKQMKSNKPIPEEVEQVQELKVSTLMSYKDKANKEIKALDTEVKTGEYKDIASKLMDRRMKGADRAANKLVTKKEEVATNEGVARLIVKAINKLQDMNKKRPLPSETERREYEKPKTEEFELDEATPTKQQVKQAIGIARDKRYAKGNVTGAVRVMDKLNPGLAQHPVVKKELQKQNEEVVDEEGKLKGGAKDPCWKGYEMVGTKKKSGKEVPNCVPKNEERYLKKFISFVSEDKAVHPMGLHVSPSGEKKNGLPAYKVHAVGAHLADGIKVGEHLTDTELDDAADMGAKIKHIKQPK